MNDFRPPPDIPAPSYVAPIEDRYWLGVFHGMTGGLALWASMLGIGEAYYRASWEITPRHVVTKSELRVIAREVERFACAPGEELYRRSLRWPRTCARRA